MFANDMFRPCRIFVISRSSAMRELRFQMHWIGICLGLGVVAWRCPRLDMLELIVKGSSVCLFFGTFCSVWCELCRLEQYLRYLVYLLYPFSVASV